MSDIVIVPNEIRRARALALFDQPLSGVMSALETAKACSPASVNVCCRPNDIVHAKRIRDEHLALFVAADRALWPLYFALNDRIERDIAAGMIGALLGGFRARPDRKGLAAMLDLIESDDIAEASEMWEPLRASPVTLALACRKLIATATYAPQPSELRAAVIEARGCIIGANRACQDLIRFVQQADAVLLEFAPREEWLAGFHDPRTLERMLHRHETFGDYFGRECRDASGKLTAFGALVEREKAALRLMEPKPSKRLGQRVVTCTARPTKRTRKPKREA